MGGVVADGDALAPAIAHQEEVAVACDVVVDAVQARVRCLDLPCQAHTVDVVARKKASVLGVAVVAPRSGHCMEDGEHADDAGYHHPQA